MFVFCPKSLIITFNTLQSSAVLIGFSLALTMALIHFLNIFLSWYTKLYMLGYPVIFLYMLETSHPYHAATHLMRGISGFPFGKWTDRNSRLHKIVSTATKHLGGWRSQHKLISIRQLFVLSLSKNLFPFLSLYYGLDHQH